MVEALIFLSIAAAVIGGAVLFSEDVQQPAAAVNVPTTAETLIVTGNGMTITSGNAKAVVRAWVELTVGASTTAVTLTIYRGTQIGGPVVGQKIAQAGDFTPGNTAFFQAEFVDILSNVGSAQYAMSVQQTGATGNGSAVAALLDSKVLSG